MFEGGTSSANVAAKPPHERTGERTPPNTQPANPADATNAGPNTNRGPWNPPATNAQARTPNGGNAAPRQFSAPLPSIWPSGRAQLAVKGARRWLSLSSGIDGALLCCSDRDRGPFGTERSRAGGSAASRSMWIATGVWPSTSVGSSGSSAFKLPGSAVRR